MNSRNLTLLALVFIFFSVVFLTQITRKPAAVPGTNVSAESALGVRTKTSSCVVNGALPDSACTPGAIFASATTEQICVKGYSASVRDVSDATKKEVYLEYGIVAHASGEYEVDHLISLELGGSNDIANLWPEAANPTPGFHEKDSVENFLHDQVCSGKMDLKTAQEGIAKNWLQY